MLVFLKETKVDEICMNLLRRRLGFDNKDFVELEGDGGLCIWWNNNIEVSLLYKGKFGFLMNIKDLVIGI